MTCNRCLQEIIEGESFWEDEAEGTAYHNDCRRAAIDRRNKAEDERAAALARAEAAEAERDDLRDANGVLSEALEAAWQMLVKLSARVAELEAQLTARVALAEERTRAAVAASLASAAAVARIGGLLGVDPSLPVEEFRETVIARVAELEAAQQWRNTLVGFLAKDDAWRICLTAMLWTESGQAKTPRIAASLRDVFGHTLNAEIPEDAAIESALREMERWFSAPSRLEEPTP